MPDPAQAAVTALAGSTTEAVGEFRYDAVTESWWWSTSLYAIHGFSPGQIVPTTELMRAHQHPDDRATAIEQITAAVTSGKPFCSRHRILDAQRRVHTVVTIGEGIRDEHGEITEVTGYLIDVTDSLHRDLDAATRLAVEQSADSRAAIEQAKGALMVTYGVDEDEAFAVLRWHSQHHNIKLRDIAARITDRITDPDIVDLTADRKITEILDQLSDNDRAPDTPSDSTATDPHVTDERISA